MNNLQSKPRFIAWVVWIVASIFYAYQYILRVMPNIMLNDIMQRFDIGAAAFGQFSGVYYLGYALMHLPLGILLDRYGPRKIMTGCILLSVVGMTPLFFAESWAYPVAGRFLVGLGSSAAILGVFKVIRMTFAEAHFSRLLSLSVTIGLLGAIYGGGPVNFMREEFGYATVIELMLAGGVLLALATYWIVPEMERIPQEPVLSNVKTALGNGRVLWACLFAGMMVGPLEGFADVWGMAFLTKVYGYETSIAASLPSLIYIGMCLGGPFLSLIADKSGSYFGTIIGCGIAMISCFAAFSYWQLSPVALSISFAIIGICSAYQILAIYKVSTYVSENIAGLTTALANMIIMTFGYAFHTVIGMVVDAAGGTGSPHAVLYGTAVVSVGLIIGTAGYVVLMLNVKNKPQLYELS